MCAHGRPLASFCLGPLLRILPLIACLALPVTASLPSGRATSEIVGMPWKYHVIDAGLGADGARLHDVNGDHLLDIATGWELHSGTNHRRTAEQK